MECGCGSAIIMGLKFKWFRAQMKFNKGLPGLECDVKGVNYRKDNVTRQEGRYKSINEFSTPEIVSLKTDTRPRSNTNELQLREKTIRETLANISKSSSLPNVSKWNDQPETRTGTEPIVDAEADPLLYEIKRQQNLPETGNQMVSFSKVNYVRKTDQDNSSKNIESNDEESNATPTFGEARNNGYFNSAYSSQATSIFFEGRQPVPPPRVTSHVVKMYGLEEEVESAS